jgi:Mn-dependent DtxR family transcriptional regulator
MPSETESLAVQLVRTLYDARDGHPTQWHKIEQLDVTTADAVEFAAARGWVQIEGGHSIALTEAGRQLAKDLGRI